MSTTENTATPAPLSEDEGLHKRFASGHEYTYEAAISFGRTLVRHRANAEDLYQTVVADLWERCTREIDPDPFPTDDEHFRATVLTAMRWQASKDHDKLKAVQAGTSHDGQISPDTPLVQVFAQLGPESDSTALVPDAAINLESPEPFVDSTKDEVDLGRFLWTIITSALLPEMQDLMRVWCREDYDRENTCAALGMNLPGYDKLLGSARKLLRRELQTVERGYFEPNSPWHGVVTGLVRAYEERKVRQAREREKKAWKSTLKEKVMADRERRREERRREAEYDAVAAPLAAAVDRRLGMGEAA